MTNSDTLPDEGGWRPIETAPKDGNAILAIVAPNDSRHLGHHEGRMFVIWHGGFTDRLRYDMGWSVYPGLGGAPDSYFSHWMPLPPPPKDQGVSCRRAAISRARGES